MSKIDLNVDAPQEGTAPAASASFDGLGLSTQVMNAVRDLGYQEPTPVQAGAIPEVLAGRDLLAAAQTGTGKTAAFLLPSLSVLGHVANKGRASRDRGPLMLVITPTRELAQQIEEVALKICARTGHTAVTVVGGVSYNPQKSALKRGCDVLVATPGRLVDLIDQGACSLSEVGVLVLDEADRMLDMGFLPAVRKIVSRTPEDRQTLLFSATLDEKAVGSITDLVRDPARVEIAPATATADTIEQYMLPVSLEAKNALLAQVLQKEGPSRVIVFTRTKHRADACCRRLKRAGISCAPIHGNRTQAQRERALERFRTGECDVLVATDVLARGIDISDVRYVVNFDVPVEPTDYIHRIGRTGRAGEFGWALTFVTEQDVEEFFAIEALMGKTADIYEAAGLELGERPPAIDPGRVPERRAGKKRTKRGKSTSKRRSSRGRGSAGDAAGNGSERRERARRSGAAEAAGTDDGRKPSRERGDGERADAGRGQEGRRRNPRRGRRAAAETPHPRGGRARGEGDPRRSAQGAQRARGERKGGRGRSERTPRQHDWRNSDLATDRRSRIVGTRGGEQVRSTRAGNLGSSRRPGDRGGRR